LKLGGGPAGKMGMVPEGPPFVYRHLGSMASVGSYKALVDLRKGKVRICWTQFELLKTFYLTIASVYMQTEIENEWKEKDSFFQALVAQMSYKS
jgi:NADH dehydrogenase FAD-containing subunit